VLPAGEVGSEMVADGFAWTPGRLLTWSDFRGRPDMMSEAVAATGYVITYEAGCDNDTFTFRVEARFLPARSWVKSAHLLDRASERTLQHERTHFDLSEVQARRARQGLAAIQSPCALSATARNNLMAPYLQDDSGIQARYDRETVHGIVLARQAEWDDRVRTWLRELPR
jgi:hypothetical protein